MSMRPWARALTGASLIVLAAMLPGCGSGGGGGGGIVVAPAPGPSPSPSPSPPPTSSPTPSPTAGPLALTGDITPVHDPAILADGGAYYVFSTGNLGDAGGLLPVRVSTDLLHWTYRGAVFPSIPAWAAAAIPGTSGLWAPDISIRHGEYRLYYAVSTFGSNHSAIGLATAATLDPASPQSGWTDKGAAVIETQTGEPYNAIDPNIFDDDQNREWMIFGSFFGGIGMVQIDPATGLRLAGDTTIRPIAARPSPDAIEGPYVFQHGGYYYLFASFDNCCQGAASTYRTVVGRATDPLGPYVDQAGTPMLQGGGTEVLSSGQGTGDRYVGRGHVAIAHNADGDYIVYHAYDAQQSGIPTLRIQKLTWTDDGWPVPQ